MTPAPEFRLVPISGLLPHEQVEEPDVARLTAELRRQGSLREPIWVSAAEGVILNGHHRHAALLRLSARRIPAWAIDYADPAMELARWSPGPPLEKAEIVRRARAGQLFPPKTSRHIWHGPPLPPRVTRVAELQLDGPESGSLSVLSERARPGGSR